MPRDYIRRRRIRRTAINSFVVAVLGATLAWVIMRQPATPSFGISTPDQHIAASALGDGAEKTARYSRGYPFVAGRYPLQEIADAAIHDANRNVDIHARLLVPKIPGRYPVIIFSPDRDNSTTCCEALSRNWASQGYAIVQLIRPEVREEVRPGTLETVRFKQEIKNRPGAGQAASAALDITSIIDALPVLPTRFPEIRGKLDTAHVGVAGHGFGAVAAEAIGGALLDVPGHPRSNLADPRVRAVVCISPQGPGRSGLTEQSFDQFPLPYLGVTGDGDPAPGKYAAMAWHKAPFLRSQPEEKYELFVHRDDGTAARDAGPLSPVSAEGNREPSAPTSVYMEGTTLAFWDAYLKHDVAAKSYLRSDALQKASNGEVSLEKR